MMSRPFSRWLAAHGLAKAAFRHHHVNVVREFALYEFETSAAFVAGHMKILR